VVALAAEIGDLLCQKGLTLGTVESATGGLVANLITDIPGSSDYFKGSVVSYSNEVKNRVVGVKSETLDKYGAVSHQVVEEMAIGGRKLLNVDICLADTGIAGPGGATKGKPVGLFYLGVAHKEGVFSRKYQFHGTRGQNKQRTAEAALDWLKEYLASLNKE
jgi:nicotinamide-nucleotide amidase